MTFFVLFTAIARAWIVAAHFFEWVAYWLLMAVIAMWAMDVRCRLVLLVRVIAVGTVNVFCRRHNNYSRI